MTSKAKTKKHKTLTDKTIIKKIFKKIEEIKTFVNADGGDVNFLEFKNNILKLQVVGECIHCPSFAMTYNNWIKTMLLDEFSQIKDVIFVVN